MLEVAALPNRTKYKDLATATRVPRRRAFFEQFQRETNDGGGSADIPGSQVRSMLAQRMQAYLMQDRARLRNMWMKYDTSNHGILTSQQLYQLLVDLGADISPAETAKFMKRFASKPGRLDFEEFCVNFIGLPPGFFKMNLADSATFADDDGEEGEESKGAKPPLPKTTSMDSVQKLFVKKMRTQLFDVDTGIREGLKKCSRNSKFLTKDDLWNLLRTHGITVSPVQLQEAFAYFDHDQDGKVDYSELCHELLGLDRPAHVRHKVSHGAEPTLTPNGQRLVHRLREKVERAAAHPRKLYQMFRTFDTDGSGEIALDEFGGMVEELGLKVEGKNSPAELLDRFDSKGAGSLSYVEFVTQVLQLRADALCKNEGEVRRPSSPELLQAVSRGVKSHLQRSKEAVQGAFHQFDKDGSNQITFKEFFEGCKGVGLPVTMEQAKEMFQLYDLDGGGTLTLKELGDAVLNPEKFAGRAKQMKAVKDSQRRAVHGLPSPSRSPSHAPTGSRSPSHRSKQTAKSPPRSQHSNKQTRRALSSFEKYGNPDSAQPQGIHGNDLQITLGVGSPSGIAPTPLASTRRRQGGTFPPLSRAASCMPHRTPTAGSSALDDAIKSYRSSVGLLSGRQSAMSRATPMSRREPCMGPPEPKSDKLLDHCPDWKAASKRIGLSSRAESVYSVNNPEPRSVLFKSNDPFDSQAFDGR